MAGIFDRIASITKANVNQLLDKFEDPEKMVDQAIIDAKNEYNKMRKESAPIIAHEKQMKAKLDEANKQAAKWHDIAVKALKAGNEDDAKKALTHENKYKAEAAEFKASYDVATQSSAKLKAALEKLADDIKDMEQKAASIKAKAKTADIRKKAASIDVSAFGNNGSDLFNRMEEKANKGLAEAEALEDMNALFTAEDDAEKDLESKYTTGDAGADDALAALKAELGM